MVLDHGSRKKIMDPIKENPLLASAAALYGFRYFLVVEKIMGKNNFQVVEEFINEQIGNIF
jgi:hypothetical protein